MISEMLKRNTAGKNAFIENNIMAPPRLICALDPVSDPRRACLFGPGFPDMCELSVILLAANHG